MLTTGLTVNHVGYVGGRPGQKGATTVIVFDGALSRDQFPKAGDCVSFHGAKDDEFEQHSLIECLCVPDGLGLP